jgi:hypothetical protein
VFPAGVDDLVLDRLDADRIVVDAQRAGGLARRRADAAGEFREVVGRMQVLERLAVVAVIDQVVPVRDDVVDRAAVVAERDAAIHAARALHLGLGRSGEREFLVVLQARGGARWPSSWRWNSMKPVILPTIFPYQVLYILFDRQAR